MCRNFQNWDFWENLKFLGFRRSPSQTPSAIMNLCFFSHNVKMFHVMENGENLISSGLIWNQVFTLRIIIFQRFRGLENQKPGNKTRIFTHTFFLNMKDDLEKPFQAKFGRFWRWKYFKNRECRKSPEMQKPDFRLSWIFSKYFRRVKIAQISPGGIFWGPLLYWIKQGGIRNFRKISYFQAPLFFLEKVIQ